MIFCDLTKKQKYNLEERWKIWRKKTFAIKLQWSSGPLRFFFWLNSVSEEGKTMKNIIFSATYISRMFCNPKFCVYPLRPIYKNIAQTQGLNQLQLTKSSHASQVLQTTALLSNNFFGIYCKLMLLFSITYTVNDSTSRAFHFFHCFEKLPCMYALLCIFSDAQDEMRWSANFLYLCIFHKNPNECTYSGNTVLKRDWIILVAALSGTTLEYIFENNLFARIYCDLMQSSWAGLTTTNGLYICLADLLRYHHIDENFASRPWTFMDF